MYEGPSGKTWSCIALVFAFLSWPAGTIIAKMVGLLLSHLRWQ